LLLRPLGNTIYVMPPYCITAPELDLIYEAISDAAALA
jgi:adenosylmethionine-8-amino-7-oxononanoate aminotransferase